jgi:hypothetical protein
VDLFVVPTISFRLLYGLLIMGTADDKFCGLASEIALRQHATWRQALSIQVKSDTCSFAQVASRHRDCQGFTNR